MDRTYRVLLAKAGLDGHDRGVKVIARALRDAGFEVIYTGLFQNPAQVAEACLQEDADAVGLSVLSGAHATLFPRVVHELAARGLGDVVVFGGGIIPGGEIPALQRAGVAAVFTPGAPSQPSRHGWSRRSTSETRDRSRRMCPRRVTSDVSRAPFSQRLLRGARRRRRAA